MSPRIHSADPRRMYRQNCRVFPSRFPCPIRQIHKCRHHGRSRTRQGPLTSHSNPVCNAGRKSIRRYPNTLPHFLQRPCKSPNSSCSQGTAPLNCSFFSTRFPCTFSEGARAYPNCISTEGDHCTLNTYTRQSPTQTCVRRPSPSRTMYNGAGPITKTCHHQTQP